MQNNNGKQCHNAHNEKKVKYFLHSMIFCYMTKPYSQVCTKWQ